MLEFVRGLISDETLTILPLTHGTKAIRLGDILRNKVIEGKMCHVLGEELVFSFYGRPAYRIASEDALKRTAGAPTYILLNPQLIQDARFMHPFDTGAFNAMLYKDHVDSDFSATDFGVTCNEGSLKQIVTFFFGSNSNYMKNFVRTGLNIAAGEMAATAYYDVISSEASGSDDRDSAIEIAFGTTIPCDADNVTAIIVPDLLEDDSHFGALAKASGIPVYSYEFEAGLRPSEYGSQIRKLVRSIYEKMGLL